MKKLPLLNKIPMLGFYTLPLLMLSQSVTQAQVLMPASHQQTDNYESDFNKPMVDFNAGLPWKERFTKDAAFDPRYSLNKTAMVANTSSSSDENMKPTNDGAHDASGVVKDIRLSSGKIKIEHGPIDRLGMPGMTMMFKVGDPSMLENLPKGTKIQFNLDNTDGGFTVTRITREGN